MDSRIIIGLVGQPLSGKDTVAAYLVDSYKFVHVSMGDLVRFYIAENNLGKPSRTLMQSVGNELRAKHGADYLARLALQTEANRLVISGVRALAEASYIINNSGVLVACQAPLKVRYGRAAGRGRSSDNISLKTFIEEEKAESESIDHNSQNVSQIISMAAYNLNNSADLEHLHTQVDKLVTRIIK